MVNTLVSLSSVQLASFAQVKRMSPLRSLRWTGFLKLSEFFASSHCPGWRFAVRRRGRGR